MNLDRLRKARELATAAMGMSPTDRERFLRGETQGDDELLEETLLLVDDDDATQLLAESPRRPEVFDEAYLAGKKQIGNYRLLRRIGQGGMGMVYAACLVAEDFQRQVALKLVKPSLASSQILRRFRMERQLLASLDHPNISRLLDAGTTDEGAPYLVMEFVEGLPIDRFCESQSLSINERLRLFLTVCDAVQYAHQNLIIHRDIKPSNILVSSEGVPKLLDFGIAKLIRPEDDEDAALKLTATDSRPMSPHYASPEQARGEAITTASDVYSLGVLLYELLTGNLPYEFKVRTAAGIEKTICEAQPATPSELDLKGTFSEPQDRVKKRLRGDLDMILLMAMRKEASRRYSSVHQFAEDIRRYLDGQTVIAQKDTVGYRVTKFVRRHTAGVIAASLAVLALVTSTVVSVHFAQVANQEKRVAERRFQDTRALARFFITDFDDAIRDSQTEARRAMVTKGVEYLRNLASEAGGDRELLRDVVVGYMAMGDVQGNPLGPNIGDRQGARGSYTEALRAAEKGGSGFENEIRIAKLKLADLDVVDGNRKSAVEAYAKLLPGTKGTEKAELLNKMGFAYTQLGRLEEANKTFREAMELMAAEMKVNPSDDHVRRAYAESAQRVGDTLARLKDYDGAISNLQKALAIYEQMGGMNSPKIEVRRYTWACSSLLADAFKAKGDLRDAESLQRANLELAESLVKDDPNNVQYLRGRIMSMSRLVDILQKLPAKSGEARQLTVRCLSLLKPLVDADDAKSWDLQTYVWILAHTPFTDLRRPSELLAYSQKWLDIATTADPQALDAVAQASYLLGDKAKAISLEQKAIGLLPPDADSDVRRELEENLRRFLAGSSSN